MSSIHISATVSRYGDAFLDWIVEGMRLEFSTSSRKTSNNQCIIGIVDPMDLRFNEIETDALGTESDVLCILGREGRSAH